jgi:hypothetical protein
MATQYTAGLTVGQVLTAATMNQIGAAWETWTPTISTTAGTITTGVTNYARYGRIQNFVYGVFSYTITTAGTAAGAQLEFTIPVTIRSNYAVGDLMGSGRETFTSGVTMNVLAITTTKFRINTYANAGWIQNNTAASVFFLYEAA